MCIVWQPFTWYLTPFPSPLSFQASELLQSGMQYLVAGLGELSVGPRLPTALVIPNAAVTGGPLSYTTVV